MWSDILTGYGIFILEILTILLVIAAIVAMIISAKQRNATHHGELVVTDLSEEFKETVKHLRDFQLSEEELKQAEKAEKKAKKQEAKALKAKLFVSTEINILGQMVDDIRLSIRDRVPVKHYGSIFEIPEPEDILNCVNGWLGKEIV